MSQPLTASMPEGLVLDHGYTITLDAVDPATGVHVNGVEITAGAVTGDQTGPSTGSSVAGRTGPYMLVPGPNA